MRLTAEVEKKEKEISRTKEELRAEADRLRTRISSRDSGYDSREDKKVESHNAVCAGLKEKIEKVLFCDSFFIVPLLFFFFVLTNFYRQELS
jgi:hypothetical protein